MTDPTQLSPQDQALRAAAHVVLDAHEDALSCFDNYGREYFARCLAAALRALTICAEAVEIRTASGMAEFDEVIRVSDILAIAAELDGTNTSAND